MNCKDKLKKKIFDLEAKLKEYEKNEKCNRMKRCLFEDLLPYNIHGYVIEVDCESDFLDTESELLIKIKATRT